MKIYFAGSIRGGRSYAELYKQIISELFYYGEVLTEHIGANNVSDLEMHKTDVDIYKQDMSWLKQSEVLVADVSVPSLGVGYELGYAACLGKRIICLYHKKSDFPLSAMLTGDANIQIVEYSDFADLKGMLKSIFNN